jgi:hypothetical protein
LADLVSVYSLLSPGRRQKTPINSCVGGGGFLEGGFGRRVYEFKEAE